jgi:hypothetical protein
LAQRRRAALPKLALQMHAMAKEVLNPRTLSNAAATSTPAERVAFLDQWLARRIAEAEAIEARINGRLSFLEKTEQGLKSLHEAIRKQVAEAMPVLEAFGRIRRENQELLPTIEQTRGQIRQVLENDLAETQGRIRQLKLEADSVVADAKGRLDLLAGGIQETGRIAENVIREGMANLHDCVESALAPALARLEADLERARDMGEQSARASESALAARLGTFEAALAEKSQCLGRQHEALLADMQRRAAESSLGVLHAMRQEFSAHTQAGREALQDHVRRLTEQAESVVEASAERLSASSGRARARALEAIESAHRLLVERLGQMELEVESRTAWLGKRIDLRLAEMAERSLRAARTAPAEPVNPVEVRLFVDGDAAVSRVA